MKEIVSGCFFLNTVYISSAGMIRFHDNLPSVIIMDRRMSRRPPDRVPACCK